MPRKSLATEVLSTGARPELCAASCYLATRRRNRSFETSVNDTLDATLARYLRPSWQTEPGRIDSGLRVVLQMLVVRYVSPRSQQTTATQTDLASSIPAAAQHPADPTLATARHASASAVAKKLLCRAA
jgi:hypothetical protein